MLDDYAAPDSASPSHNQPILRKVDVVILGGGLAGLSLARQLTLRSDKTILLLEKRPQIPPPRQKVGEATVQLSGYYFSKVLDLEEHLLQEHLMKYNLRFYWKVPGSDDSYEDYSQSYIRNFSNIASYQLDRNKIEEELLRHIRQSPNVTLETGISGLAISLSQSAAHRVHYTYDGTAHEAEGLWVVDTTGRSRFLARQLGLQKRNMIRHGSSFFWVDGLMNIERLTGRSLAQTRLNKQRCMTGHLPVWLATNHFVGEGFWFWVIPLHGKTSLGLVYDREKVAADDVATPDKLIDWVCREFPLFARDLKTRKVLDHGVFADFSYDCQQTISGEHWALAGEAGRFSDPLYSPGGDLIALHNTLIADCILTSDDRQLHAKVGVYEVLMRAFYQAYVPSYTVSYEVLGDQECFALKYAWELTIYFTFFVFPFINDLFTELDFSGPFLREFAKLGALNRNVQRFITSYYRWKKGQGGAPSQPQFFDFTELRPLQSSAELFYRVGLSPAEAASVLKHEMHNLTEFARFIVAHVYSVVLGDPNLVTTKHFVEEIDLNEIEFNAEFTPNRGRPEKDNLPHDWGFDAHCLTRLRGTQEVVSPLRLSDAPDELVVIAK
jgi:2-polyprenyl-6-methoxyphenol hydroxylase-like FAD-dependent oxidoreductase